jgi:hypothetical protein
MNKYPDCIAFYNQNNFTVAIWTNINDRSTKTILAIWKDAGIPAKTFIDNDRILVVRMDAL